jgi:hypothetical protein
MGVAFTFTHAEIFFLSFVLFVCTLGCPKEMISCLSVMRVPICFKYERCMVLSWRCNSNPISFGSYRAFIDCLNTLD